MWVERNVHRFIPRLIARPVVSSVGRRRLMVLHGTDRNSTLNPNILVEWMDANGNRCEVDGNNMMTMIKEEDGRRRRKQSHGAGMLM